MPGGEDNVLAIRAQTAASAAIEMGATSIEAKAFAAAAADPAATASFANTMKQAAETGDTSVIKASAAQINTIAEKIRNPDREPSRIESGKGTMGEIHAARQELREARAEYKVAIAEDIATFQTTRARATENHQDYFQHNGQLYAVGTRYEAVMGRDTGEEEAAGNYSQPGPTGRSYGPDPDKYGHQNQVDDPEDSHGLKDFVKGVATDAGGPIAAGVDNVVDSAAERQQEAKIAEQADRIAELEKELAELTGFKGAVENLMGIRDDGAGAHPGNSDGTNGDGWE